MCSVFVRLLEELELGLRRFLESPVSGHSSQSEWLAKYFSRLRRNGAALPESFLPVRGFHTVICLSSVCSFSESDVFVRTADLPSSMHGPASMHGPGDTLRTGRSVEDLGDISDAEGSYAMCLLCADCGSSASRYAPVMIPVGGRVESMSRTLV